MKCFYTTRYNITTNRLFHKIKILILSDLHFSYKVKDKKLSLIISEVERVQADYILFVGDLVDSLDMISDENEMNRFIQFFHKLSSVSKLIISLGNHDCYKKRIVNGKFCGWNEFFDEIFINRLKNIPNTHVLINDSYEDDNIYVLGIYNKAIYYHQNDRHESKCELINNFNSINKSLLFDLPKNKINIMMIHSPVYMLDGSISKYTQCFDYIISGHMHNGCVPPILNELWKSTRGIISPTKELFIKNIRNTIKTSSDKLIVNGALTTFHECTGMLEYANVIFPIFDTVLKIDKGIDKIEIIKKYHK